MSSPNEPGGPNQGDNPNGDGSAERSGAHRAATGPGRLPECTGLAAVAAGCRAAANLGTGNAKRPNHTPRRGRPAQVPMPG